MKKLCTAVCLGALAAPALAVDPVLSASATPDPAVPGGSLNVEVFVVGVVDLYAYQFSLSFNPAVLQATGVTAGALMGSTGASTFFDGGTIDNTAGTISFIFDSLIGAVPGVSGNGVLANIGFSALVPGSSTIAFSEVIFLDSALADITMNVQPGSVGVVPEPAGALLMALGVAGLLAARRRPA